MEEGNTVIPGNSTFSGNSLVSGTYQISEIQGEVIISVDLKDKVNLEGRVKGKGKLFIENAHIYFESLEGDLDVTLSSCWIHTPLINKTSSLLVRGCTFLLEQPASAIVNEGLKMVLENSKIILTGEITAPLVLICNSGELLTSFRLASFIHAGHTPCFHPLTFVESKKGQVEMVESGVCTTSLFLNKPILVGGEKSLVKLTRFIIFAEQEFIPTMVNESSVSFTSCLCNGKHMEELDEKQDIIGDYNTHMSGKVHIVNAKEVLVNTDRAPVTLQLPLHAKHNQVISIAKTSKSAFPVKIKTSGREFILGQGNHKPCLLNVRFSSRGWVEKRGGKDEPSRTMTDNGKSGSKPSRSTTRKKQTAEEKLNTTLTRSKQIREKFNKGRQARRELFN
ncbi:Hypothetical protein BQ3484_109 [Cedratvirus A11]|uniref:Uncharacterized protein n=1 Tax=Cedratvirus A11 TaxID=1903266 RepID=A0A1M7XU14_9VIRU|nr:Hypothetical protein BQ3484_109 [Cedratvirus A11]SHO33177.1 Hypothetical protein BQ3484_109 [Cedratvirus A11]